MENNSKMRDQIVLEKRNPKLKLLNDFMLSVIASVLDADDMETAAGKLNKSARSYLKSQKIVIPDEVDPPTVKFRVIHHGTVSTSTSQITVRLKPRRCNPYLWHYTGWYREGNSLVHVYENDCGDMAQCGGHSA